MHYKSVRRGKLHDEEELDRAIGGGHGGLLAWGLRSHGPWHKANRVGGNGATGRDCNNKRTADRQPGRGQPSAQPGLSGSGLMVWRPDRYGSDLLRVLVDNGLGVPGNRTYGGFCVWCRLGA